MSVGPSELIVILIVVLLLFGSRRIAALGKGIGEGIRGFKRGIAGEDDDSASAQPAAKSGSPTGAQPTGESVANHEPKSAPKVSANPIEPQATSAAPPEHPSPRH